VDHSAHGPHDPCLEQAQRLGNAETQLDFTKFDSFGIKDWQKFDALVKFIATLFLFCFITNGVFVLMDEYYSWCKIDKTFRILKTTTSGLYEFWLYMDVVTNCWVVLSCCIASYLVLGSADNAKDTLFDALGLLFLYNLDDISGDLGFVDRDEWPGHRMAWVYEFLKNNHTPTDDGSEDEFDTQQASYLFIFLYMFTLFVLSVMAIVLPMAFILTPFEKMRYKAPG